MHVMQLAINVPESLRDQFIKLINIRTQFKQLSESARESEGPHDWYYTETAKLEREYNKILDSMKYVE